MRSLLLLVAAAPMWAGLTTITGWQATKATTDETETTATLTPKA
jgi:hypothetical protein